MRVYLSTSKRFYDYVADIKAQLESHGHVVTPPNGYNDANAEALIQRLDAAAYRGWKADMLHKNSQLVAAHDAILVLNLTGPNQVHYLGGATFLEIFKAFELHKQIFLYETISPGPFADELSGMSPTIINGDLSLLQ